MDSAGQTYKIARMGRSRTETKKQTGSQDLQDGIRDESQSCQSCDPVFRFCFLVGNYSGIPVGRERGWEQLLDFERGVGQNSTLILWFESFQRPRETFLLKGVFFHVLVSKRFDLWVSGCLSDRLVFGERSGAIFGLERPEGTGWKDLPDPRKEE